MRQKGDIVSVTIRFYLNNPDEEELYGKLQEYHGSCGVSMAASIKKIVAEYFQMINSEEEDKNLIDYMTQMKEEIMRVIRNMQVLPKSDEDSCSDKDYMIPMEVMNIFED